MPMRRFGFYEYSCIVWCINVLLIILSHFISGLVYTALIFEIAVVFLCVIMIRLEKKKRKFGLDRIFKYSTTWSKVIALLSIVYTVVSFSMCIVILCNGAPHIHNGVYCLRNGGFIREITKEEYDALVIVEGRLLTGHALTFSAIPVVYFSARKNILNSHKQ